ncbi:MAG: hypothetical protein LQ338_004179 [Usnochroma carphineum]|nr:MAG: hypothetical protein LQ338_004179 [Usnochroma carphineum]
MPPTINGGRPIVGKFKKGIVLDLSMALGYHVPATRKRDEFYAKIENERAKRAGII